MPPVAHADEKADVQNLADGWMAEYNKHDADALTKRYADDAVFSNALWTANGRTAIKDALAKDFTTGMKFGPSRSMMRGATVISPARAAHGKARCTRPGRQDDADWWQLGRRRKVSSGDGLPDGLPHRQYGAAIAEVTGAV